MMHSEQEVKQFKIDTQTNQILRTVCLGCIENEFYVDGCSYRINVDGNLARVGWVKECTRNFSRKKFWKAATWKTEKEMG
jgi:hypothetical protein